MGRYQYMLGIVCERNPINHLIQYHNLPTIWDLPHFHKIHKIHNDFIQLLLEVYDQDYFNHLILIL